MKHQHTSRLLTKALSVTLSATLLLSMAVVGDVFGTTAVRLGIPGDFGGLQEEYRKPDYATAVGLVVGSINQLGGEGASDFKRREEKSSSKGSAWSRFLKKFF